VCKRESDSERMRERRERERAREREEFVAVVALPPVHVFDWIFST